MESYHCRLRSGASIQGIKYHPSDGLQAITLAFVARQFCRTGLEFMGFPPSNRVPGDTKVSGKWNTQQHDHSKQEEFYKPLRQVVHYAKLFNTRYAYIISDKELVCISNIRMIETEHINVWWTTDSVEEAKKIT
ncbi:uncharacterized protein BDCG_17268 [Blastomyces dermatitidis ER-3]|uniref:Uncharacterized protein n=2 Tax=Ajellomyces dermatitidis TaxID=5039 RepID=A0A0J9EW54_AJEDA|nr:uncharacterized protein BDCG_17268 [Blastomyces dermatitidis ER-3]EQL30621.1 hypothetical protein BDFG_06889 [Blastomyces dermatitidis ATCC 26199]KMW69395.1 hypothetical protein BDDG_13544 [Blastomyces dermatitidis ATCC 18188]OAT01892.1 hypothetical protein BDCG_17268 [Blastomyces dermatitidis ER-3]